MILRPKRAGCLSASRGTSLRFTAPYTSAHNGRVERLHRTLMNKARSMWHSTGLPPNRWHEFLLTANYLTIRTHTRSLPPGVTPFERYFSRVPDLSNLREIGCKAFVLIQNTHNPKIYDRSVECVLIGYGPDSKTFRCYHRSTSKVISSYHVVFVEAHEAIPLALRARDPSPAPVVPLPPDDLPADDAAPPTVPVPPIAPPAVPLPPPAAAAPPAIRCSSRIPVPSEKCAHFEGIARLSAVDSAVAASKLAGERSRAERLERIAARDAAPPAPLDRHTTVEGVPEEEEPEEECNSIEEALAGIADGPVNVEYPGDPNNLKEAYASPFADQWRAALADEFKSIKDLGVYKLVPRSSVPAGRRIMKGRPVFRLKRDENGNPVRFKARWVCKGYEAVFGQDYTHTSSPTMRMESFRVLLHIAAANNWELHQVDIKTAFLYGFLPDDEVCYMEQPSGFEEPGQADWVWELIKGLYGMKQGGRVWNKTMHSRLIQLGFTRLACEYCIYTRCSALGTILTGVHVDDFAIVASTTPAAVRFKEELQQEWQISDLGEARFCIGIAIERDRATCSIRISQTALIDKIISQFRLSDAYPVSAPMDPGLRLSCAHHSPKTAELKAEAAVLPYRALVGSLMYVAIGTRPDIMFAVQNLSQFLDCYGPIHWEAAKRVVRYLKGTRELRLTIGGRHAIALIGFTDADHGACLDSRRSVSGYCFSLGSGIISWCSRKQKTVSTSSCESEYVAGSESSKELVWLRALLTGLGFPPTYATPLLCDNNSAIKLSDDPSFHSRVKHIDIKYHLIREYSDNNVLHVSWISTHDNVADIFTKPLGPKPFLRLRAFMGIR